MVGVRPGDRNVYDGSFGEQVSEEADIPRGGNCLTFGCSGGEMISATAAAAAVVRGTRELCADKSLDGLAA